MKLLLSLIAAVLSLVACNKQDRPNNTSVFNLYTFSLRTSIPENLQAVYFVDGKTGFVAGLKGGIYKTTDSAKTWTALNSNTSLPIYGLSFTDSLNGFAVGGQVGCSSAGCTSPGGFILKTINGGQSWINVFTPSEKTEILSVYFINNNLGFCIGRNIIMKTTDAGQTWAETKIPVAERFMKQVRFKNAQEGYVVCSNNVIVTTNDGGNTWTVLKPMIDNGYYATATIGNTVYATAQNTIIKSTSKGASWTQLSNAPGKISNLYFADENTGYAFGSGSWSGGDIGYTYGSIYTTKNGGLSWDGSPDIRTGDIKDVSFPVGKIAYALSGFSFTGSSIMRLTLK